MGLCQSQESLESLENQVKLLFFIKKEPLFIARTIKYSSIMLRRKKNKKHKYIKTLKCFLV